MGCPGGDPDRKFPKRGLETSSFVFGCSPNVSGQFLDPTPEAPGCIRETLRHAQEAPAYVPQAPGHIPLANAAKATGPMGGPTPRRQAVGRRDLCERHWAVWAPARSLSKEGGTLGMLQYGSPTRRARGMPHCSRATRAAGPHRLPLEIAPARTGGEAEGTGPVGPKALVHRGLAATSFKEFLRSPAVCSVIACLNCNAASPLKVSI